MIGEPKVTYIQTNLQQWQGDLPVISKTKTTLLHVHPVLSLSTFQIPRTFISNIQNNALVFFFCGILRIWKIRRNWNSTQVLNYILIYSQNAIITVSTHFSWFVFSRVVSMLQSSVYAVITIYLLLRVISFLGGTIPKISTHYICYQGRLF